MLGNLLNNLGSNPQPGQFFELNSETYLVVTRNVDNRETLESQARNSDLHGRNSFKILSYKTGILSGKKHVGLLKVERIEVAGLLKVLEDKLIVRFDGEYTTKELSLDRFENQAGRLLLRDPEDNLLGVFHEDTGTFLKAPDRSEDSSAAPVQQINQSMFRNGIITAPDSTVNGNRSTQPETTNQTEPESYGLVSRASRFLTGNR